MPPQVKSESGDGVLKEVLLEDMAPWEMQPRKRFSEEKHKALVESVRQHGVIQPIMVRMVEGAPARGPMPVGKKRYQIIAGERRWRAATEAGKTTVLCVLRDLTDAEALELALVENLFRDDLDVFEEAEGYKGLVALGWTVVEIADRFKRTRDFIYRRMDLLKLEEEEREAVRSGSLAEAAGRELAKVPLENRKRAMEEVLHPKYSALPMNRDEAVNHLKRNFVKPAEEAEKWEKGRADLEKQFPDAEVMSYDEGLSMREYGSGWVAISDQPQYFEVVERLRAEGAEIPCWGDLAEKYGAPVKIVPGEEDSVIRLVERKVVMDGDIVNAKAGECVFNKPRGEEDEKEERLNAERVKAEQAAREEARKKELKGFLEEMKVSGVEGVLPALIKVDLETRDSFVDVYNAIHGTELNHWDDGSPEILEAWVSDVVKKSGLKGWLWLHAAQELVGFGSLEYPTTADAVGIKRSDWPALCEEGGN